MPAAPFMPMIAQGAGMGLGALFGKNAQNSAMQRSPEEQQALTGAQGAAGNLGTAGSSLLGQGGSNMGQAGSYYSTLLRGNRAAMANATAGQRAGVQDSTRGMQSQINASGVRGAAKDQLMGNMMRQQGGQLSGLTTGMQPWAASQLGTLGGQQSQIGTQASNASGNIFGNLLKTGQENRQFGIDQGTMTGGAIGKLVGMAGAPLQGLVGGMGATPPSIASSGPVDPYQLPGWSATPS